MAKIKFLKIRNVKSPTRAYEYDAGIDFYVPDFNQKFLDDLLEKNPDADLMGIGDERVVSIAIPAQGRIMIPSGIKSRMHAPGRALIAANKSGVATKHVLVYGAQVVDYTYKGEIHLSLINTSDKDVMITPGMKILQFLETPVWISEIEIVDNTDLADPVDYEEEFYKGLPDDRGADGFGSTDKK